MLHSDFYLAKFRGMLSPKFFALGVTLGFLSCVIAGYYVSTKTRLAHFVRFHAAISPTTYYYPTVNQLINTVLHKAPLNKILVLVGGNSQLRGTGQNVDTLWSSELQKMLGSEYKVINFANDGATIPSLSSVIFKILSERYPKIIYISNMRWGGVSPIDGKFPYTYLFWDAYYKGLYQPSANEKKIIKNLQKTQLHDYPRLEEHMLAFLDSLIYFRDLWNWIGYRYFFFINEKLSNLYFKARIHSKDSAIDLIELQKRYVASSELITQEADYIKKNINRCVEFTSNKLSQTFIDVFKSSSDIIFDRVLRDNIILLLIEENPNLYTNLDKKFLQGKDLIYKSKKNLLLEQGYNVVLLDKLQANDFIDGGHPNVSGGKKIAISTAKQIINLSKAKGLTCPVF